MLPTPDLSHITKDDYGHIYEPAEDTFILLDALEEDEHALRHLHPRVCLEIGSGSGCATAFLGNIVRSTCPVMISTDINPHASQATLRTGMQNKIIIEPILTSLVNGLLPRLRHQIDVLLFNPPYVPTEEEEAQLAQAAGGIAGAWAGGMYGMGLTNILLDQVPELLSSRGRFYLVAIKQNDVPGIQRRMQEQHGLHSTVVLQRRAGREHLFVLCFTRPSE